MAVCFRERAISTRKLFRPLSWESWSLPVPVGKPQWGLPGEPWGSEPVCCGPAPSWVPRPTRCAEQTQGMCLQVLYTLLQSECSFGKIKKRILFLYILEITLIDYLKFDTFPEVLHQGPWMWFRDLRIWVGKFHLHVHNLVGQKEAYSCEYRKHRAFSRTVIY